MGRWWEFVIIAVAVIALVVIPLIIRRQRRRPRPGKELRAGGRIVGAAIVIGWIVVVWAGATTLYQAAGIAFASSPVLVLTQPYWPEIPPNHFFSGDGTSTVTSGGYTEANAVIPDLSVAARIWDVLAVVVQGAAIIMAALVVIRLCRNLRAGRGLAGAARSFGVLSVLSLVGGFVWDVAHQLGGAAAAQQVAPYGLGDVLGPDGTKWDWPTPAHLLMIDLWPIAPFLAFGALAAAFRYAERLQKDTEGLI